MNQLTRLISTAMIGLMAIGCSNSGTANDEDANHPSGKTDIFDQTDPKTKVFSFDCNTTNTEVDSDGLTYFSFRLIGIGTKALAPYPSSGDSPLVSVRDRTDSYFAHMFENSWVTQTAREVIIEGKANSHLFETKLSLYRDSGFVNGFFERNGIYTRFSPIVCNVSPNMPVEFKETPKTVTLFDCTTGSDDIDGSATAFKFNMIGFGTDAAAPYEEDGSAAVQVSYLDDSHFENMLDNCEISQTDSEVRIDAHSDEGSERTSLSLTRTSGFRSGYFRLSPSSREEDERGTWIQCELNQHTAP